MKGYAIEIKLFKWQEHEGGKTIFTEVKSHYLGNFSSQTSERTYERLDSFLFQTQPGIGTRARYISRRRNRR